MLVAMLFIIISKVNFVAPLLSEAIFAQSILSTPEADEHHQLKLDLTLIARDIESHILRLLLEILISMCPETFLVEAV